MIETIYNDFTTQMLPKIAEGLTITKDYFTDLFGRYVNYLIVSDSIYTIIGFILLVVGVVSTYKVIKFVKSDEYSSYSYTEFWIILTVPIMLVGIAVFFENGANLIKDIYIPEVRVYQELQGFMK